MNRKAVRGSSPAIKSLLLPPPRFSAFEVELLYTAGVQVTPATSFKVWQPCHAAGDLEDAARQRGVMKRIKKRKMRVY